MAIVTLRLPNVKRKPETRPRACPYCQGETFQRWGFVHKPVKDSRYRKVKVYLYLCCRCRRTFRNYPEGVDQADQTQRLHKLAAVLWVLGISLRGTSVALAAFGVELSHMSVWRDLQEQADQLQKRRHWQSVRVLGVDGAYPLGWGKKQPVLVAVDMGTGQPVAVGAVMVVQPKALLLDEPTRGLDYAAKRGLLELLQGWRAEGVAILLVTHDVELAALAADQVVLLENGQVSASGSPSQVLAGSPQFAPQISRLFPGTGWLTVEHALVGLSILPSEHHN